VEVLGEVRNRTKVKRRKAHGVEVSCPPAVMPDIRRCVMGSGDGIARSSTVLPGESSRLPRREIVSGNQEGRKDEW
jgi:hypothetical protein